MCPTLSRLICPSLSIRHNGLVSAWDQGYCTTSPKSSLCQCHRKQVRNSSLSGSYFCEWLNTLTPDPLTNCWMCLPVCRMYVFGGWIPVPESDKHTASGTEWICTNSISVLNLGTFTGQHTYICVWLVLFLYYRLLGWKKSTLYHETSWFICPRLTKHHM